MVALVAMPPCYATSEREVHTSHDKYKASSSDTSHAWTSDGRTPAEVAGVHVWPTHPQRGHCQSMRALCTTLTPRHTRHAESQKYPAPLNMPMRVTWCNRCTSRTRRTKRREAEELVGVTHQHQNLLSYSSSLFVPHAHQTTRQRDRKRGGGGANHGHWA